jgi:DNA modification methylase
MIREDKPGGNFCSLCDAWRGAFGLEPTIDLYLEHSMQFLRAIHRVLRKDGVVFWNIGDSYASGKGTCFNPGGGDNSLEGHAHLKDQEAYPLNRLNKSDLEGQGLKPKDLCLIPERFAIMAQQEGYWVRSRIAWVKSNPMPESVKDRPTDSWETIWMLTKGKSYYWDAEAVREPQTRDWSQENWRKVISRDDLKENSLLHHQTGKTLSETYNPAGRNIRNVWEINTQPYPKAHFATFPEKIPERCILAATSEKGNCSKCGTPWSRIIEENKSGDYKECPKDKGRRELALQSSKSGLHSQYLNNEVQTIGWKPQCSCEAPTEPPVVLDPFSGSGTTLWVAKKLGRRAIGIDSSQEYCDLAIERNGQQAMSLASCSAATQ